MGRVKGTKNKQKVTPVISSDERLRMIANIVIERILEEIELGRLNQIIKMSNKDNE